MCTFRHDITNFGWLYTSKVIPVWNFDLRIFLVYGQGAWYRTLFWNSENCFIFWVILKLYDD